MARLARPKVESYVKLIAKKAWMNWRKLPPASRAWIDPEDLINDGVLFVKSYIIPHYRPHRGPFSTFLIFALDQYYMRVLMTNYTGRRNACQTIAVAEVKHELGALGDLEDEIHAVESLKKIAHVASPILRRYLGRWLVYRGNVHRHGLHFQVARSELLELAKKYNFTYQDFEFLLKNETWRKTVSLPLE